MGVIREGALLERIKVNTNNRRMHIHSVKSTRGFFDMGDRYSLISFR